MGRLYIKCFSFRIGSFNMFCRKLFYVLIKKHAIIEDDEKQRGLIATVCLERADSLPLRMTPLRPFLLIMESGREGLFKKKKKKTAELFTVLNTRVCVYGRGVMGHRTSNPLWFY